MTGHTSKEEQTLRSFRVSRESPVSLRVGRFLRASIESGALGPGTRLPDTRTLAKMWGVNPSTVQAAMVQLTSEGLLAGAPGRGRHVQDVPRKLTCVGIYERAEVETVNEFMSMRFLSAELRRVLGQADIKTRMFVDDRRVSARDAAPMSELAQACSRGEIQGVILTTSTWKVLEWMSSLGVPFSAHSRGRRDCVVEPEAKQAMNLALRELARRGCRSFGVFPVEKLDKRGEQSDPCYDVRESHDFMLDLAAHLNLAPCDKWMLSRPGRRNGSSVEQFGYDSFKRLWNGHAHPDGLYVRDDVVARGVLLAMSECGVRVPDDLKLVLFRCQEIGMLCPVPASFVELSLCEVARALIAHLERQVEGHPPARTLLRYRLVQ